MRKTRASAKHSNIYTAKKSNRHFANHPSMILATKQLRAANRINRRDSLADLAVDSVSSS